MAKFTPRQHRPDWMNEHGNVKPGSIKWLVCDCQLWQGCKANLGALCTNCEAPLRQPDDVDVLMYRLTLDLDLTTEP